MIYALVPILVLALCLYLGKRLATLVVIIAYLNVEGFFKLLSNYNRVVHVGMDIVVLGVAAMWVADAVVRRRAGIAELPWMRLILFYALWVVLQVLSPMSPGFIPTVASFKLHLTMIALYFMTAAVIRKREDVVWLFAALVAVALLPYAVALVQYALGPRSVVDLSPRFALGLRGYHEWRPFGTSAGPGGTSVVAFLVTPLAVALLIISNAGRRTRLLAALSVALAVGVFFVSGVRNVFLGCLLALLVMILLVGIRQRARGLVAIAIVSLLGLGAYTGVQAILRPMATQALLTDPDVPGMWRQNSITDRLGTLRDPRVFLTARPGGLKAIYVRAVHYPFGTGLGRIGPGAAALQGIMGTDPEYDRIARELGYTENFFAVMIQEVGLPGVVMLTILLVGLPVTALRQARRTPHPVTLATSAAIAGVFLAVLVMSWGAQPLTGNPISGYYWLLAGVLAALARTERDAQETAHEPARAPTFNAARTLLA